MTEKDLRQTAFQFNTELITSLNRMDFDVLENKFGIHSGILAEIKEDLSDYFESSDLPELKISETDFHFFKYDTVSGYGIEAKIFTSQNKKTELTLHTELDNNKLKFRLIEVM